MQNTIMITNSIEGLREFYLQNLGAKTYSDGFLEPYAEAEEFLSPYYSTKEIKMGLKAFSLK